MSDWHDNIITSSSGIAEIIRQTKRIAVLGIKTEAQSGQPAIEIPRYMANNGYEIVPVPVYYPEVSEIFDTPVYRTVASIPTPVDMVNVFRRSQDVAAHLDDLLAAAPRFVWLQSGIRDDATAEQLAKHGIRVVQDRCLMVEHARMERWA